MHGQGPMSRQELAGLLQHTYQWVRAASAVAPPVAQSAPPLAVAVQLYSAGQYAAAQQQLSRVLVVLQQARHAYPALPPL
ncbi:hypothetical protein [Nonomuraea basaltis]|uniref:hypothetical protein n=1 Tax=Nonomuraea basaltis TaxID=2495887 RepID=UPI00110C4FEA|nr:hypothetical protein [Nonomuraea basaltis]TMR88162.1 hypothetical protein EJK15_67775 [Nonomuraea basaltis]